MTRFLTIIAAALLAAAITIPAVADDAAPSADRFVSCLRARGLDAPTDGVKQWLAARRGDAAVERAVAACKPASETQSPQDLVACLRRQGLDAPATLEQLKPWLARTLETDAGRDAAKACGFEIRKEKAAAPAPCGEPKAPAGKPEAEAS